MCLFVCVCVCCVWDSLEQVWGSECAAGGFVVFVCVCLCLCVLRVGQFGASLGDGVYSRELCDVCACVCCVWDSLEHVWGSECAAVGFVVCVCV